MNYIKPYKNLVYDIKLSNPHEENAFQALYDAIAKTKVLINDLSRWPQDQTITSQEPLYEFILTIKNEFQNSIDHIKKFRQKNRHPVSSSWQEALKELKSLKLDCEAYFCQDPESEEQMPLTCVLEIPSVDLFS